MGRKSKPDDDKAKTITFRGSIYEKRAIDLIAESKGVDVADLTREALMSAHGTKIAELASMLAQAVP